MDRYIQNFEDVSPQDMPILGAKNAFLGEMFQQVHQTGIPIPDGFAVKANAYQDMLSHNYIHGKLDNILARLDTNNFSNLRSVGRKARQLILENTFPYQLQISILAAYEQLKEREGPGISLVVRSSATAPGFPEATFNRQQDSFMHITGPNHLLEACLHCYASLYTDRAIQYRVIKGIDHKNVSLSIGVQRMVRSDLASSGVGFTLDPKSGFKKVVVIKSSWGLGKNILQGSIEPDEFAIYKPSLKLKEPQILSRNLGSKQFTLRVSENCKIFSSCTQNERTPLDLQNQFSILESEVATLAGWGLKLEKHYGQAVNFEWAKDGISRQLYLVQTAPRLDLANQQESTPMVFSKGLDSLRRIS